MALTHQPTGKTPGLRTPRDRAPASRFSAGRPPRRLRPRSLHRCAARSRSPAQLPRLGAKPGEGRSLPAQRSRCAWAPLCSQWLKPDPAASCRCPCQTSVSVQEMPLGMERLGPLPAPGDLDVTPGPRAGSPAGIAPPGGDALLAPVWPWKGPSCSPRLPAAAHELCPTCPAGVSGAEPARPSAPRTYGKEEYKQRTRAKWRTKAAGSLFAPPSAPRPLASHPGGLAPRLRGPAPPTGAACGHARPYGSPFASPGCLARHSHSLRPGLGPPSSARGQRVTGPRPPGGARHVATLRTAHTSGFVLHGRESRRGGGRVKGLSPGHGHGRRLPSRLSG